MKTYKEAIDNKVLNVRTFQADYVAKDKVLEEYLRECPDEKSLTWRLKRTSHMEKRNWERKSKKLRQGRLSRDGVNG